jgi:hypothetical protein
LTFSSNNGFHFREAGARAGDTIRLTDLELSRASIGSHANSEGGGCVLNLFDGAHPAQSSPTQLSMVGDGTTYDLNAVQQHAENGSTVMAHFHYDLHL